MKDQIFSHLDEPAQLERMYRSNKLLFKKEFNELYPQIKGSVTAEFWKERLNYEPVRQRAGRQNELLFLVIASLLAGVIAKLPDILNTSPDYFYPRNIGFIVFPFLAAYFVIKNNLSVGKILFLAAVTVASVIFINSLPQTQQSDTLVLSCVHLLLVLWCLLGFAFVGEAKNNFPARLSFLKYCGDLLVMCALIVIAGVILSGITVGLFSVIGFSIEDFYFRNVVVFALPAVPIVGTYLIQTNPNLVGRVSPVIARIFSPLVLVMLVVYLGAMLYSGKNPYSDREFLMIFNALLIGVMAIVFFSIAGASGKSRMEMLVLLLLSFLTIIVNGIALSAILFRISEWGFTPNRTAVLGANILILINLLLVCLQLFKSLSKKDNIAAVGRVIAWFLPVYFIWTIVVTFLFPLIFGYK